MKSIYSLSFALLLFLFVSNINTVSAQIRFGVRGGVDVINNNLDFNILKVDNRLGYQIGPTVEFLVPMSGFGGEISVLYGRKEYKMEDKLNDNTISDYNYISIPVNIKQRFGLGPVVGLFFTGGVYGNVKIKGGDIGELNINGVISDYKAKNFALGLNAGAGVSILGHFDVGLYFKGDLTKRYGDEYMDAGVFQNKKNQTWTVNMSYYF